MKALICSTILVCSTLLCPGGSPIKVQLLEPTEPISLKPEHKALMAEVAAAQKEKAMITKSWEAEPKAKRDYTRLREIEEIISKGRALKQSIKLTLRLTNTSNEKITIPYGGDTSTNTISVKGPAALDLSFNGPMTADYRMGKQTTIAAGKSADFVLTGLRYGKRDSSRWLLTAPGQYTIKLSFLTHLGKNSVKDTSNEITLEVKE